MLKQIIIVKAETEKDQLKINWTASLSNLGMRSVQLSGF